MTRGGDRRRACRSPRTILLATGALLALAAPASAGDGTFTAAPGGPVPVGQTPVFVIAADVDEDGDPDLVATNKDSDSVSVLIGDGSGGFAPATSRTVGDNPETVAAGDFNGDGHQDLATADFLGDTVSILLGDGAGGFGAAAAFTVGDGPIGVVAADLNGDARLDIVAADYSASTVTVRLGDGAGGFGAAASANVGLSPFGLAVGDLDGDGAEDVATANFAADTVSVLIGDGAGGFAPAVHTGVGTTPTSVAFADIDRDGDEDLVSSDFNSDTVSVLIGDGAGGLGAPTSLAVGDGPTRVAVADVDGDGDEDLVTTAYGADTVSLLRGDGTGGFAPATTAGSVGDTPYAIAVADLDRDGDPDLATADSYADTVSVLLGKGPGADAGNLLVNPGAEGGGAAGMLSAAPAFTGWTRTVGTPTYVRYSTVRFPSLIGAPRWGGGTNVFSGGPGASAEAEQIVGVADRAASIDAGLAGATLSGLLGGYGAQDDTALLKATFRDGTGAALGSPLSIGPVTAADRRNRTVLLRRTAKGAIPTGTRSILITMVMTRATGTYGEGTLDDLSLRVSAPAPPPGTGAPSTPADPPAATRPAALVSPRASVSPAGVASVGMACPASAPATCRGTIALSIAAPVAGRATSHQTVVIARGGRRINLGRRAYAVAPGRRATIGVRLNRAGRSRMADRRTLAVRAVTTVRQPDGTSTSRTSRITLSRGAGW